jgi:hypothetical protein
MCPLPKARLKTASPNVALCGRMPSCPPQRKMQFGTAAVGSAGAPLASTASPHARPTASAHAVIPPCKRPGAIGYMTSQLEPKRGNSIFHI